MSEALKTIAENQRLRDEAAAKVERKVEVKSTQTLQQMKEAAAMIAGRYDETTMKQAQKRVGMTEQQIEDFRRN